ncbi:IS110 family transposase [Bradyrhizobium sp. CCH5-F6]|jgi:transposase|uniref:IS110 family transposase n=1 Tax=Bradyrhizobium sp. CCH5-F6 TaxID=1768753 RepID=UPI000769F6F2|nr:IS110 family transposase [Bradyrhizobium sp. CCH5-F6]
MHPTIIGLDLAKHIFQAHGIDAAGKAVLRKKLRRSELIAFFAKLPPCVVGMEACGTAHYWGRELTALGHQVKLMPAAYVKPYVKRGKNDEVDAEAICEAVTRPTMRFVPIKSAEQQSILMLHRTRDLFVRQRTMLVNSLRGQLAEFGLIAPKGVWRVPELEALAQDGELPEPARACAELILMQIEDLQSKIKAIERTILARHRANELSLRLATIPGVGIITATALVATVANASAFRSGRHFAAWIGLVPRQNGSGGKMALGGISKRGEPYLRRLLVLGATAVVRYVRNKPELAGWVNALLARRPARVVTVAVANKLARIVWAIMQRGGTFRERPFGIA